MKVIIVNQSLHFSIFNNDNTESIIFDGYEKSNSSEIISQYFSEEYKLFILYYGGLLLAKKDQILLRMIDTINEKLTELINKTE